MNTQIKKTLNETENINQSIINKKLNKMFDNFINHFLDNKLNVAMWNMDEHGVLNLYKIIYVPVITNDKTSKNKSYWTWQSLYDKARKISEYEIKEKIKPYLNDYAIDWQELLKYKRGILLTYPSYEFEGKIKELNTQYVPASQTTVFSDKVLPQEMILNTNQKMHEAYLTKYHEYNIIRKVILENMKEVNPEKYELILSRIDFDNKPEPIMYFYCNSEEEKSKKDIK